MHFTAPTHLYTVKRLWTMKRSYTVNQQIRKLWTNTLIWVPGQPMRSAGKLAILERAVDRDARLFERSILRRVRSMKRIAKNSVNVCNGDHVNVEQMSSGHQMTWFGNRFKIILKFKIWINKLNSGLDFRLNKNVENGAEKRLPIESKLQHTGLWRIRDRRFTEATAVPPP